MPIMNKKFISLTPKDNIIPYTTNRDKDVRYSLAEWKYRYSIDYRISHPKCTSCQRLYPYHKLVVDHIIPLSEGGSFWDVRNHQSLCQRDHSRKTNSEKPGSKTSYTYNDLNEKIPI